MSAIRMALTVGAASLMLVVLASTLPTRTHAFSNQSARFPNGTDTLAGSCGSRHNMCHIDPHGSGPFTSFGYDYQGEGAHTWNLALAMMDSDHDGWTNGEELGDTLGTYVNVAPRGQPPTPAPFMPLGGPGNPGDPHSWPGTTGIQPFVAPSSDVEALNVVTLGEFVRVNITLPKTTVTEIKVYDLLGHMVAFLAPTSLYKGTSIWRWSTVGVANGSYLVVMTTPQGRKNAVAAVAR